MYTPHTPHRDRTPGKSQWEISESDEINCFNVAKNKNWLIRGKGWGLHLIGINPDWLGVAQDHITKVFIAKFVSKDDIQWHGYPADYRKNSHDIPDERILKAWVDSGQLPTAKIRKIAKGQPCYL